MDFETIERAKADKEGSILNSRNWWIKKRWENGENLICKLLKFSEVWFLQ